MNASDALIHSLLASPLLVGDLPNAARFPHQSLVAPSQSIELNIQQKLGHLFEDAFAALLISSPGIELLEQNLQVQRNCHWTVGELDFLIRESDGKLTHLEIATKFYLAVRTSNGFDFPGPDSRDSFDRKLQRLLSHQLTLTKRHKDDLPPVYRDEDIRVRQLIYGCLFDHINESQPSAPEFSNPGCRRGKWLRLGEMAEHFPDESQFHIIPKHLWPVPVELLEKMSLERWKNNSSIDRCQMLRVSGSCCPYFVAPDEYPRQP